MDPRLCWWCMAGLTPWFSTFNVIVKYPLFIASHDRMHKIFPFCRWGNYSYLKRCHSMSLGFNSYGTQCFCFWIISNTLKRFETVVWSTPNDYASSASIWHESSWSNVFNSSSSNFFGAAERFLSSTSKSLFLERLSQCLHVVSDRAWSP